jgi:hypothetical protein
MSAHSWYTTSRRTSTRFLAEKKTIFFVRTEHHTYKNSSVSLLIDASDATQWIDAICLECKSASALFNWSIITYQGNPVPKELMHF